MSYSQAIQSIALAVASVLAAAAQEPLTLQQAARTALQSHPSIDAADAAELQAGAGIVQARSELFPRLSWSESYTRGNNPVYAFGTLLDQKRFSAADFALSSLNNPDAVQNFRSLVSAEQTLFDANRTKHAVRAARLEQEMSAERRRSGELDVLMGVVRTYFGAVVSAEGARVAEQAVASAEADLQRAQAMFEAGLTTKADVLAVQVHRSTAEQERIRAVNDYEVSRAALNDAIGLDLDAQRELVTTLAPAPPPIQSLEEYVALASADQPDLKRAALGVDLSAEQTRQAEAERWPTIVAQGVVEADRARFVNRGGGNWLAGVSMRWDLWKGYQRRAKIAASRYSEQGADAQRRQAASAAALSVRSAWFNFQSAEGRRSVAQATVEQAEESLRIVRNRYESGLETVTELLRSESALTNARFRRLAALYEQRTARAGLEYVAGRLTVSSEVMQ
jgi:outer membrane protein TolC